jgi:hypothetical protein
MSIGGKFGTFIHCLVKLQNCAATFENILTAPQNVKYRITI